MGKNSNLTSAKADVGRVCQDGNDGRDPRYASSMRVIGVDFTSRPQKRKPITAVYADLVGNELTARCLERWVNFESFEFALRQRGPWIAGIDFPFCQSKSFIQNIGWPTTWSGYVEHLESMSKLEFKEQLRLYRDARPPGNKEHRRAADIAACSISPQKVYGVPVALMFYEGAPRLLASGVHLPGIRDGDLNRTVVEAYPGALARYLIGRTSYKSDDRRRQTAAQLNARREILDKLQNGGLLSTHGVRVCASDDIVDDPGGDDLDALLCAVQAAAAWLRRYERFGAPEWCDSSEGWIAEPTIY